MMRDIATAMDGFCVAVTKGRTKRRFWPKNAETGCCRSCKEKEHSPGQRSAAGAL